MSHATLPTGTDQRQLLEDFTTPEIETLAIARKHDLSLDQLAAWARSETTRRNLETITFLTGLRTQALAAQIHAVAIARLLDVATLETPGAPSTKPRPAAEETARKAAAQLLRLLDKAAQPKPVAHSPAAPEQPPPPRATRPRKPAPTPTPPTRRADHPTTACGLIDPLQRPLDHSPPTRAPGPLDLVDARGAALSRDLALSSGGPKQPPAV